MNTENTFSEEIAHVFNYLSITAYLIIFAIIIILCILIFIKTEKQRTSSLKAKQLAKYMKTSEQALLSENYNITSSKHIAHSELQMFEKEGRKYALATLGSTLTYAILLITIISAVGLINTYHTARTHGYRGSITTNAEGLWKTIHTSPIESKLPDDLNTLKQSVIIYYRFGCPDCDAVYPELSKIFSQIDNVYWIASRSEQGKTLLEKYPVNEVPTAIYIKSDGTQLTYVLYENTNNGTTINTENINDLMDAIAYDRTTEKTKM